MAAVGRGTSHKEIAQKGQDYVFKKEVKFDQ